MVSAEARIATRWVGGSPAWSAAAEPPAEALCGSLLASLLQSLNRGHHRVAVRRFLVMSACGAEVPREARLTCEAVLARLSARELTRAREGADRWLLLMQRL